MSVRRAGRGLVAEAVAFPGPDAVQHAALVEEDAPALDHAHHRQTGFAPAADEASTRYYCLCLGPQLGPGRFALLGIVDDGDPLSVNALVSFEISGVGAAPCYPNCDGSTAAPVLNVADFSCFLTRYASGDAYANCDGSTQPPALNVQDFSCFLARYATGCP